MTGISATQSTFLQAACEVAALAAGIAARHFRDLGVAREARNKSDGSPVTRADIEAEHAAREWIERRFPGDGIVGEELGTVRPEARRRWIVDPIDGTKSFVCGVPLYGTLIAVAEGDEILAGAAHFPSIGEVVCAARGEGCFWNGARASVSDVNRVEEATVLTTDERFLQDARKLAGWRTLSERARLCRSWGDCFGYLLVATGRAELMADGVLAAWDAAAILPIVEEAGGVFTDWTGARTAFGGSAVATNRGVADTTRALLGCRQV